VPSLTWMRSHTGAGDSIAGGPTPAAAELLPGAAAAVPCCRGRGATYTSQPPTSRTRSAGTAAETLSVSIALLRTQKGNGCPTATTPTCTFTFKHLDSLTIGGHLGLGTAAGCIGAGINENRHLIQHVVGQVLCVRLHHLPVVHIGWFNSSGPGCRHAVDCLDVHHLQMVEVRLIASHQHGQDGAAGCTLEAACVTLRTMPSEMPSSAASADGTSMMLWPDVAAAPCQATCHTELPCRLPAVAINAHM
jgi:hypothetical protein